LRVRYMNMVDKLLILIITFVIFRQTLHRRNNYYMLLYVLLYCYIDFIEMCCVYLKV